MRRAAGLLLLAVAAGAGGDDPVSAFAFRERPDDVRHDIDLGEILRGVSGDRPARDAIPAIREPVVVAAAEATWLAGEERVLGVSIGGEARAYPLFVLEGHELVNDELGGTPIAPNY